MWQKKEDSSYIKQYVDIKELFLNALKDTQERCTLLYHNKYDQERYFSISIHPEIEKNRILIECSMKKVEEELMLIEKLHPTYLKKRNALIAYIEGLVNTSFKNLFMIIFKGKLSKYCLPEIKNILPCNNESINLNVII